MHSLQPFKPFVFQPRYPLMLICLIKSVSTSHDKKINDEESVRSHEEWTQSLSSSTIFPNLLVALLQNDNLFD